MTPECWTDRYTGARVPPDPLHLKPPLKRAWKRERQRMMRQGFVRAGDGAVFTATGLGDAFRLDLGTGETVWNDSSIGETCLITRWKDELVVFDDRVRFLEMRAGSLRAVRNCEVGLGVGDSYVVGDILVGMLAGKFHAVDLNTLEPLWEVPELVSNPLVGDDMRVIRAQDDVTCYDLKTGAVRWHRPRADFGGGARQMGFLWRDLFVVRIGEPLLLTALEAATGQTVWRAEFPVSWCEPYSDRAYGIEPRGVYRTLDLATGKIVFEKQVSDVPAPGGRKTGLMVSTSSSWPWRDAVLSVSETHVFVQKPSGQIVVLGRETGEVEDVVEIDGMPSSHSVIYENRLLLTDFNAAVYCFEGAS